MKKRIMLQKANKILAAVMTASMLTSTIIPGTAVYASEISAPEVEDGFTDGLEEETPVVTQEQGEETPEFDDGSAAAAGSSIIQDGDENVKGIAVANYEELMTALEEYDYIKLNANITLTTNKIYINRSKRPSPVTIDLAGHSIDGNNKNQIFNVYDNAEVTIKNSNRDVESQLINGKGTKGGAISNAGKLTLENIKIVNNVASNYGGGIYNAGSLELLNVDIQDNASKKNGGGGIYNKSDASLVLKNEIIIKNNTDLDNEISNLYWAFKDKKALIIDNLTGDSYIGLDVPGLVDKTTGDVIAENFNKDYLKYFTADKDNREVGFKGNDFSKLYIGSKNSGLITQISNHKWEYKSKGDKIIFSCTADDADCIYKDEKILLQLIGDESVSYSNTANELKVEYEKNIPEGAGNGVTIEKIKYTGRGETSYNSTDAPKNAGTYTATVEIKIGNDTLTITKNFEIKKINPEIEFKKNLTYSGSSQSLINKVPDGMTVKYRINGGEWSNAIPTVTDAGIYTVEYEITGDDNHNSITGQEVVTVNSADAKLLEVTGSSYSKPYDGAEHSVTVTAVKGATIKYSETKDGGYTEEVPKFKTVGKHTIYYEVTKKNYEKATGELIVEISKRKVTVEGITAEDKTYDGTTNADLEFDKAEIKDAVKSDGLTVTATGTFSQANAGKDISVNLSKLSLEGKDADNYELVTNQSQTTTSATIEKRPVTISITPNGGSYGSVKGATATASNVVSGDEASVSGKIKFTYSGTANDGTKVENSSTAPTEAGNYTVSASLADDSNYELDSNEEIPSADFKVAKAKVEIPDIVYKEADGDKTVTADIKSDSRYAIKKNEGGNKPGVYDVTLELKDPNNYEWDDLDQKDKADISLKFEITEKGKIPTSTDADTNLKDMDPSLLPVSRDDVKEILKNTVNADDSEESEEVKNLVNSGDYTASANLKVEEKTKEQIADKAAEVEKAIKSGEKIGTYLDASLRIGYISADGTQKGNVDIKDTGKYAQTITTTIPKELRQDDAYTVRSYYVVRISEENGKLVTEKVDSSVNGDQITFTFDKSAVYAIVYKDTYYSPITPSYPVTGIKVSTDKVNLTKKGETAQVKVEVTPSYADNKNLTWKSSDEKVATVDKDGKITAVGNGTATITVTSVSGNYTATITVTVNDESEVKPAEIEKITIDTEAKTLTKIGESVELKVKVEPENADSSKLTWKSSNEKVAVVDKDGKVTAVGNGTATITVSTEDGKHTATVTITVKVADEPAANKTTSYGNLKARSVKQTNNSITLEWTRVSGVDGYLIYGNRCNGNGKTYKYQKLATITNSKTRTWTQKDLKKGTYYKYIVKAYKLVNGKKVVTDTSVSVHAVTKGGKYGVAKAISVTKIGNKKNTLKVTLKNGKTAQITAKEVKMDKPIRHHRNLCYESSNTRVATVTPDGLIQATGKGTCSIWVYAQNGVYKTITVTVK